MILMCKKCGSTFHKPEIYIEEVYHVQRIPCKAGGTHQLVGVIE